MEQHAIRPSVLVNNELYYTITEAALVLGISEKTLRREMNRRKIQIFPHPSKGYLFLPVWLDEWIQSRIIKPRKSLR